MCGFLLLNEGSNSADCLMRWAFDRSISQRKSDPTGIRRYMLSSSLAALLASQTKFRCSLGTAKHRESKCWRMSLMAHCLKMADFISPNSARNDKYITAE